MKATRLRTEYPASARIAGMWATSAPSEVSLGEIEDSIGTVLRSDPEVSLALAGRALADFDLDRAIGYADRARKGAPEWAQPQLMLAQINVAKALKLQPGFRPLRADETALLEAAEEYCSRALDLSRAAKDQHSEVAALIHRVDVRLLLKRRSAAADDAENAYRLDSDDAHVLLASGQVQIASGSVDEGISLLGRAHELYSRPEIAFLYGKALCDRGREGDLEGALKALREISLTAFRAEMRPSVVTQVIQCFVKRRDWSGANTYLDQVSTFLDPVVVEATRGYLAHHQDARQDADRHAAEALSLLEPGATPETKDFLARLLMLVGRPTDALPLWQELFDVDPPSFDYGNLLDCAAKLHRDDVVLKACGDLHARGIDDWHFLEFEIQYLQKYNMEGAIARLREFIERHPDHKLAQLRLSVIGLLVNRLELVRARLEDLPGIDELPLEYARPAVQVIKLAGNPDAAVDYAYRYLRSHFHDIDAHQALVMSLMPGPSTPTIPPTLDVVEPDAAVCYRETPVGDVKWVVLEDTTDPNSDFEELPLTSPLAQELIGKKLGEKVVLAKGRVQDRTATIVQILPKYVRRYQDSMGEMQVRFGPASGVESVRVGASEERGSSEALETILAPVEERAEALTGIREVYRTSNLSLHLYGKRFGSNAYIAVTDLSLEEGEQVKCSFGTSEERNQAVRSIQTAKAVIVDITAIATLRLLGLTKVLSSTKYKFVLSQGTWITFHEMLSSAKVLSAPSGTLTYERGRPVLYQETPGEREQRNREDEEFIRFLEKTVELKSGVALAAVEPSQREILEKVFGQYGAEAIALASEPDYVLWTDDLFQSQVAAQFFGVRRVWTQLVLGTLADAGLISLDEYSEASARLIGMEYIATSFDASTVLAGLKLAGWSPHRRPAAQFVKIFADPSANVQQVFGIFVSFVAMLFREAIPAADRCAITRAFLDALGGTVQGMVSLESLRRLSSRVFGLNAVGEKQFMECFDHWLKYRDKSAILSA